MKLLGKNGADLIPLLNGGSLEIASWGARPRRSAWCSTTGDQEVRGVQRHADDPRDRAHRREERDRPGVHPRAHPVCPGRDQVHRRQPRPDHRLGQERLGVPQAGGARPDRHLPGQGRRRRQHLAADRARQPQGGARRRQGRRRRDRRHRPRLRPAQRREGQGAKAAAGPGDRRDRRREPAPTACCRASRPAAACPGPAPAPAIRSSRKLSKGEFVVRSAIVDRLGAPASSTRSIPGCCRRSPAAAWSAARRSTSTSTARASPCRRRGHRRRPGPPRPPQSPARPAACRAGIRRSRKR
jgi:hypothetical protein